MSRARRLALAAIALVAVACTVPLTDAEVRALVRHSASAGPEAKVVVLNASNELASLTMVADARGNGPIEPSRRLALGFARAARAPVHYVVGGPYATLNDQVLRDAFAICKEPRLPGLHVTLVSPDPPSEELAKLARDYGARLEHRIYLPPSA